MLSEKEIDNYMETKLGKKFSSRDKFKEAVQTSFDAWRKQD